MTLIIIATLCIGFYLLTFHFATRGKEPTFRVIGGWAAAIIALIFVWSFRIWPSQEFLTEPVVLTAVLMGILGLVCLWRIFRPGWNRTR